MPLCVLLACVILAVAFEGVLEARELCNLFLIRSSFCACCILNDLLFASQYSMPVHAMPVEAIGNTQFVIGE